jgi:hypothetical protein
MFSHADELFGRGSLRTVFIVVSFREMIRARNKPPQFQNRMGIGIAGQRRYYGFNLFTDARRIGDSEI